MSLPPKSVQTEHTHDDQPENDFLSNEKESTGKSLDKAAPQGLSVREIQLILHQLGESIDRLESVLPPIGKLATVKLAAKCLGISPRTIRAQLYLGRWQGYRVGRAVRVDPVEIRKLMKKEFLP